MFRLRNFQGSQALISLLHLISTLSYRINQYETCLSLHEKLHTTGDGSHIFFSSEP